MISGWLIAARVSSLGNSSSSCHSVTITAASAPVTASSGESQSSTPCRPGRAIGSQPRTSAPSASSREASTSDGASRMSSVFGLKASPSSAMRFPRSRPRCRCSFWRTRRFCSSFTSITAFMRWKW